MASTNHPSGTLCLYVYTYRSVEYRTLVQRVGPYDMIQKALCTRHSAHTHKPTDRKLHRIYRRQQCLINCLTDSAGMTKHTHAFATYRLSSLFRQLMLTMRFRQAFSICFDLWQEPLLLLNLRYIVPNLLLHYQSTFSFAVLCFCFLGCSSGEHTANRQNKASSSTELPQSACLAYISGV